MTDGLRLSSLWQILHSIYGYQLIPLPHDEWLSRLRSQIFQLGETHLLFPLLHILESDVGSVGEDDGGLLETSSTAEEAVMRVIEYLIEAAFLPRPGGSSDAVM